MAAYYADSSALLKLIVDEPESGALLEYRDRSDREDFLDAMASAAARGEEEAREAWVRWGRGVSFHEFELVFGDLREHVIASSYDVALFEERPIHAEEFAPGPVPRACPSRPRAVLLALVAGPRAHPGPARPSPGVAAAVDHGDRRKPGRGVDALGHPAGVRARHAGAARPEPGAPTRSSTSVAGSGSVKEAYAAWWGSPRAETTSGPRAPAESASLTHMERVGIREMRQNLSRYARRARGGESFVSTDRSATRRSIRGRMVRPPGLSCWAQVAEPAARWPTNVM